MDSDVHMSFVIEVYNKWLGRLVVYGIKGTNDKVYYVLVVEWSRPEGMLSLYKVDRTPEETGVTAGGSTVEGRWTKFVDEMIDLILLRTNVL